MKKLLLPAALVVAFTSAYASQSFFIVAPVVGAKLSNQTPASLTGGGSHVAGSIYLGSPLTKTWDLVNLGERATQLTRSAVPDGFQASGSCGNSLLGGDSCMKKGSQDVDSCEPFAFVDSVLLQGNRRTAF